MMYNINIAEKESMLAGLEPTRGSSNVETRLSGINNVNVKDDLLDTDIPDAHGDAALFWFSFGFSVIPICPDSKQPFVKWQPWLDQLSEQSIRTHWGKYPQHHVGMVVDSRFFILDADSPEAVAALDLIEKSFDIVPLLVNKTNKGEHHFFRRATNTYAKMASFSTDKEPEKLDIRTGRTLTEGRSIIVLPPSKGKKNILFEVGKAGDLSEVDQDFIDSIAAHNGTDKPREIPAKEREQIILASNSSEASEIVGYIDPDCGYELWTIVGMGLHAEFKGSEEGLKIYDAWSRKGSKYPGCEVVENKWRSFNADKPITLASVCKLAAENGADLSAIARKHQHGDKRSFDDLLVCAKNLTEDSCPDEVEKLVKDATRLSTLKKRVIHKEIKNRTKIPFKNLTASENGDADKTDPSDDLTLARQLVEYIGSDNILAVSVGVYRYLDQGVWQLQENRAIKQLVQTYIGDGQKLFCVKKSNVDSITDLFISEIFKPDHRFNVGEPDTVNCLNGELECVPDVDHYFVLMPHNKKNYRTTQIPVEHDRDAKAPRFEQFLKEVFKDDEDAVDKGKAILEMLGYTLMAHCRHEKFLILVGTGANGKSVLLAIAEALCGSNNVAGVQPSQFGNKFQRAHLRDKLANIVTEIQQGEVIDDAALKGIVSGEPATVEHKFKDPFVMRPFSTCWFGTNHMPHTRDFSDALFRRALVVEFNQVFKPELGNCDPKLKDKLMKELPGILNLALNAYSHALTHGFTMPESCLNAREEWRLEADQVAQFVDDVCERDLFTETPFNEIFKSYQSWATNCGITKHMGAKGFRDRLTRLGFGNKRTKKARMVQGVKLLSGYSVYDV